MKKIWKFNIGGLESKVFNLCVLLVIIAITAFAVIGILQLRSLSEMTEESGEKQAGVIKENTQTTMTTLAEVSMLNTVVLQTQNINGEFWTLRHDFQVLAKQVQDVFDRPQAFVEREVSYPNRKNQGVSTLQLLSPNEDGSIDAKSRSTLARIANLGPMMREIIDDNPDYIMDCIVALPNGVSMAVDRMCDQKYDENGKLKPYDPRERPWYKGAVEKKGLYFTPAIHSFFYDLTEVVFGMPVYENGELVAVLEGAIKLDMIQEAVTQIMDEKGSFCALINKDGQVVYSPITEGDLAMDDELSTNAFDTDNEELKTLVRSALDGKVDFDLVKVNDKSYYVAYAPIETVGWTLMVFLPEDLLTHSADDLLDEVDKVSAETKEAYTDRFSRTSWITLLVLVVLIANSIVISTYFARRLLKPIKLMTQRVEELSSDNLLFEFEKAYETGDEIEVLARAFSDLSEKTRNYIRQIMQISAEREKIATELSIATMIQQDSLPSTFPAFPDRHEVDIYASMTPAKAVGGDFYDMFFIDDDHLAFVIADVSDKGVPAALFMMISKTIIKVRAKRGGTPAEILEEVNNLLAENNKARMFVTVFLAILDVRDGSILTANAGHEYPVVRPAGGKFDYVRGKHGFVLGCVENMKYTNTSFTAHPGDMFFVYTDGVAEASNANEELYGPDRLLEALNETDTNDPKELLEHVRARVDEFVGEAPQFDDMTMMSMVFYGKEGAGD